MDWCSRPYGVAWWGSLAASLALSALVTWLGIRYARHRNLIDQPGRRRSHRAPTPRGGGIGIVAACAVFFVAPLFGVYHGVAGTAAAILTGILAVAAVGWWDDHFGLGAIPRLAVHVLAAGALAFSLLGSDGAVAVAVFALATVWSINLHNFMDGIDGILGAQALFVFAALALLGTHYAQPDYVLPMAAAAAATLGFLPFNFPRARVFMGDVGSGTLGFLIAAALGLGLDIGLLVPAQALVIVSTFVIDASCTLASRMWRGRRWYSAHREHLYQWLARRMSHARVVGIYTTWNLLIVAPAMLLLEHMDGHDTLIAAFVYASGITAWALGKRWCLDKVESSRHA